MKRTFVVLATMMFGAGSLQAQMAGGAGEAASAPR